LKVLIIDNNDSFTYNLKHYINKFSDLVDVVRHNNLDIDNVGDYDKILFSPGPGLPKEYPILNNILIKYGTSKSILGICLGQQAIAEFYGCKLENLSIAMHGVSSMVKHLNNCSLYKNMPLSFKIGHYHSWVVSHKNMPEDLVITSINEGGLIMSLKHRIYDINSVQFHPESIMTEHGIILIENWLLS
jgi:anthranilate synthase component 2